MCIEDYQYIYMYIYKRVIFLLYEEMAEGGTKERKMRTWQRRQSKDNQSTMYYTDKVEGDKMRIFYLIQSENYIKMNKFIESFLLFFLNL